MKCKFFILLTGIIFFTQKLCAQGVEDNSSFVTDTSLHKIFYFNASKDSYLVEDIQRMTYDYNDIHYYDEMISPFTPYYQYLSTKGSASQSLLYSNNDIFDYQRQCNTYLPYIFTGKNVKYFQNRRAYTSFNYSNGLDNGQYFDINFAKNIYKGLNLQTEYKVNYANGDFQNSGVKNQFFNVSLNYISTNGLYRANGAFVHNRAFIQENGGILSDSLFINDAFSSASTYPTNSSAGWSKWKTNEFYFNQSLRLSKDTLKQNFFNAGALIHSISFERYARLYNDENMTSTDSLGTTIWRNSLFWTNDIFTNKTEKFFIPLHIGVNYDIIKFSDLVEDKKYAVFTPEARVNLSYFGEISYKHSIASNNYSNDFQIDWKELSIIEINKEGSQNQWKNKCKVYFDMSIQNKQADYIFSHYQTANFLFNNKVGKTFTERYSLGVKLFDAFDLKFSYFDIKDSYWFDKNLQLNTGNTSLIQIVLNNKFNIGRFGFKGSYVMQNAKNEEVIRLPLLTLKQGVYYNFTMFQKKLYSQVGVDLNYFTSYYADDYNYRTGMFVRQNEEQIGNYLYADVYLDIKIQRFTLFVTVEHPYAGLVSRNYFNTPLYPHQGFTLRYGFSWKLLD